MPGVLGCWKNGNSSNDTSVFVSLWARVSKAPTQLVGSVCRRQLNE